MSGSSEEIARLRRVAYGPGATAEERTNAEAALAQLDCSIQSVDPVVSGVADAEPPRPGGVGAGSDAMVRERTGGSADEDDGEDDGESIWRRSIRVGWLVPIVVAALGVGAFGALGVTGQRDIQPIDVAASESPPADVPIVGPPAGDLEAADNWFLGEQGPQDTYPDASQLEASHIDPASVRFMVKQVEGTNVVRVWVAKNLAGDLCLVANIDNDGMAASSCTPRDDFARDGLAFGANNIFVSWDGNGVTVGQVKG